MTRPDRTAARRRGEALADELLGRRTGGPPPASGGGDPILFDEPPPPGVRAGRAGLSCGRVGPGHTRALIVCSTGDLKRRIRAWRCACGAPAIGEDRFVSDREPRREGSRR